MKSLSETLEQDKQKVSILRGSDPYVHITKADVSKVKYASIQLAKSVSEREKLEQNLKRATVEVR